MWYKSSNLECPHFTITEVTSSNIIDTKEVGYNESNRTL